MGAVWSARHVQLTSDVAIKLMSPAIAAQPEALQRFLREARSAARLSSLHVVKVFDYGVDGRTPFIAMELLAGESLRQRLDRDRVLAPATVLRLMRHAGRALSKAHAEGIVHRDLKPENLFITREEEEILKVLDFGVAKLASPSSGQPSTSTRTGAVLGTPFYMSPEQARGIRAVDHRSDLWALGVIAYECLLGALPFDSAAFGDLVLKICTLPAPVPSSVGSVPEGFDAWFARAVEREPDQRFQSVDEMLEALQAVLGDAPAEAPLASENLAVASPRPAHVTRTDGTAAQTVMVEIPKRGLSPRAWALLTGAAFLGLSGMGVSSWLRASGEGRRASAQSAAEPAQQPSVAPAAPSITAPGVTAPGVTAAAPGASAAPAAPADAHVAAAAGAPESGSMHAEPSAAPSAPTANPAPVPEQSEAPRPAPRPVKAAAPARPRAAKRATRRAVASSPADRPAPARAVAKPTASKPSAQDLFSDPD